MTYPLVQLVDQPDLAATVRFDFNGDDLRWPDHDSFDLGSPPLLGDPDGVGSEYGLRALAFRLMIRGGSHAVALALQAQLARELQRNENWLLFQLSPTAAPVWFKVYRSSPGAVSLAEVDVDDETGSTWQIGVSLVADPFAYGERVILGPYTVTNSPSVGVNPMRVTLPDIKGDAPAPLDIWCDGSYYTFGLVALSQVRLPWKEAEDCTLGTGTTVAALAGASGGQVATISFGDTSHTLRLTWDLDVDLAGDDIRTYLTQHPEVRVVAQVGVGPSVGVYTIQAQAGSVLGDKVTIDLSRAPNSTWLVDLGVLSLTTGAAGEAPTDDLPDVELIVGRTSGTGSLNVDFLLLVATEQVLTFGAELATSALMTFVDSEREQIVPVTGTIDAPRLRANPPGAARGGFPKVHPGEATELMWIAGSGAFDPVAAINMAGTADLTLAYRPQHLYLAG